MQTQQLAWPASHMVANWDGYPNMLVQVARDYQANTSATYISGYVTDTIALNRLTVTAGLRFDRQSSSFGGVVGPGGCRLRDDPAGPSPRRGSPTLSCGRS